MYYCSSSLRDILSKIEFVIEIKILNKKATPNPSILKPAFNILEAIKIMDAFMTNKKNPKDTTVIGNVRNTKIGLR